MDVLLMASDIERMPVALGEAMRAGLPVVVAPWPGFEDFVRDGVTGVVAADGTPHELARALARLRGDAALRAAVVRGAQAFADEHFSLERTVREHVDLYRALRDERAHL
jgi:glycosyltransferase involved in cell wall biosynthesis